MHSPPGFPQPRCPANGLNCGCVAKYKYCANGSGFDSQGLEPEARGGGQGGHWALPAPPRLLPAGWAMFSRLQHWGLLCSPLPALSRRVGPSTQLHQPRQPYPQLSAATRVKPNRQCAAPLVRRCPSTPLLTRRSVTVCHWTAQIKVLPRGSRTYRCFSQAQLEQSIISPACRVRLRVAFGCRAPSPGFRKTLYSVRR